MEKGVVDAAWNKLLQCRIPAVHDAVGEATIGGMKLQG
jgi:hypothetical protein